jgi:hypothetical protein
VTWVGNGYGGWGSYAYGPAGFLSGFSQSVAAGVPQNFDWTMPTSVFGTIGISFNQPVSAAMATSYVAIGLPPGISLKNSATAMLFNYNSGVTYIANASGIMTGSVPYTQTVLSGTPTKAGTYKVVIYPVNADGVGNYTTITITINP